MLKQIKKLNQKQLEKKWYKTHWLFDLHSTLIKPHTEKIEWYPFAKECLQLLTLRDDINLVLWTSAYHKDLIEFLNECEANHIHFNYVNENPATDKNNYYGDFTSKFYFDLIFEDKAEFEPEEWEEIYLYLCSEEFIEPLFTWQ